MIVQTVVVACLVAACMTYAAWTLMPASMRRTLALALLKLPLPKFFSAVMEKHSAMSSGCACDGCDKSEKVVAKRPAAGPMPDGAAPIVFHPRLRK